MEENVVFLGAEALRAEAPRGRAGIVCVDRREHWVWHWRRKIQ
jgi:hypothetical protein